MKSTAILVLAGANGQSADSVPVVLPGIACIEHLRTTLNALWSEDPGCPADVMVYADSLLSAVARREHGNRVQVCEQRSEVSWGEALNLLVDCMRHRFIVLLDSGAVPTPGWLYEMTLVAEEEDGMLVGPCLPNSSVEGSQAATTVQKLARPELRQAATQLRFREPRSEVIDVLAASCIGVPRKTINRIGRFDTRYQSLAGVLLDYQRRARSWGGRLLLARRALLGAPFVTVLSAVDRQALEHRAPFFAQPVKRCPPIALEIEVDDPARLCLCELANGLIERGLPVHTFSLHSRVYHRPSQASHVQASTVEVATRGAVLTLLRSEKATSASACRLEIVENDHGHELHKRAVRVADSRSEGIVRLVQDAFRYDRRAEQLDAWALEIFSAACALAGDSPC